MTGSVWASRANATMSVVSRTRTIMAMGSATPRSSRMICISLISGLPTSCAREVVPDLGAVVLAEIQRGDLSGSKLDAQAPRRAPGDLVGQHVRARRDPLELETTAVVGPHHKLLVGVRTVRYPLEEQLHAGGRSTVGPHNLAPDAAVGGGRFGTPLWDGGRRL